MRFAGTLFSPVQVPIVSNLLQLSRCKVHTCSARCSLEVEYAIGGMRLPGIKVQFHFTSCEPTMAKVPNFLCTAVLMCKQYLFHIILMIFKLVNSCQVLRTIISP